MTQTPLEADLNFISDYVSEDVEDETWEALESAIERIRQALTGAGEPVGYRVQRKDWRADRWYFMRTDESLLDATKYKREPLFTSPQTPTPDPDTVPVRREDAQTLRDFVAKALNAGQGNTEEIRRQYEAVANVSQALQVKP